MATGAIQYGQYRVPTVDEMVNFGVGQVSIDINCQGMIPYKYIDDLSKNLFHYVLSYFNSSNRVRIYGDSFRYCVFLL